MDKEVVVSIPLKDFVKEALVNRADKNGRSMGREAERIIERTVIRKVR